MRVVFSEVDEVKDDDTTGEAEGRFDGVSDALLRRGLHSETVNDSLDRVLLLLLELRRLSERVHCAIDADARETLDLQIGHQIGVLALALANDRREHLEPRALLKFE